MSAVGAVAVFGALAAGGVVAPAASAAPLAAAGDPLAVCSADVLIVRDVTWSHSDQDLADANGQTQDAITGLAGSPIPVNVQVTTFGEVAPMPDTDAFVTPDGRSYPAAENGSAGVVDVSDAGAGAALAERVSRIGFVGQESSGTNWEAALISARALGMKNVPFVTDGVPTSHNGPDGKPTNNGGFYDPEAVVAAKKVADQMRAEGFNLVPVFIRTDRPSYHGLDDPEAPVSREQVEEAMQALQPGWTIDKAIPIGELATKIRDAAFASCTPGITIEKTHKKINDVNGNGLVDAGDKVTWVLTGKNTGNLPLTDVKVEDPTLAMLGVKLKGDGAVGSLAVGAPYTVESEEHSLTQADVDKGEVHNVATVRGNSPAGPVTDEDDDTITPDRKPAITLEKSHTVTDVVDVNGDGRIGAGDTVRFTLQATNTGTVTASDVTITDPKLAAAGIVLDNAGKVGVLAPGESKKVRSGEYTFTVADEIAGGFHNIATVTGNTPVGPVTDEDDDTVTVTPPPAPAASTPAPAAPQAHTGNPLADMDPTLGLAGAGVIGVLGIALGVFALRSRRKAGETATVTSETSAE